MTEEDQSSPHNAPATPEPSSRWSPDPFNPPISPHRPNGGYSTDEYPDSGLSKYGPISGNKNWRNGESSSHARSPAKKVKMGEGALEKTFQRQQVMKEVEEEISKAQRESSPSTAADEDRSRGVGPGTPSKKRKTGESGQGQSSPSPIKGGKNGKRRSSSTNTTPQKGQADIRGFFSPNRGGS